MDLLTTEIDRLLAKLSEAEKEPVQSPTPTVIENSEESAADKIILEDDFASVTSNNGSVQLDDLAVPVDEEVN